MQSSIRNKIGLLEKLDFIRSRAAQEFYSNFCSKFGDLDVYSYVTCVVMVQLQLKEHLHHDEAAT